MEETAARGERSEVKEIVGLSLLKRKIYFFRSC